MSSITACPSPARRTVRRLGVVLGVGILTSVGLTGVAFAHVEITPDSVPGGEDAEIAFRVPNESDSASTVAVKVLLPKNHPIPEVQTTSTPGWSVTTQTRKLDKPIDLEGEKVDTVVSQITWKAAAGGGIRPDQYQDFAVSLEGLPDSGTLVFNAVQTYSDGDVVNWNEVSADPSVEPEHPAPTLTLTAADASASDSASDAATDTASDSASDAATDTASDSASTGVGATTTTTAETSTDEDSGFPWAILMAGAALVVSLLTALVVWRRGRPATPASGDGEGRPLEDNKA